jgi:hypothetical protein
MSESENKLRGILRKSMELNGDVRRRDGGTAPMSENAKVQTQKIVNVLVAIMLAVFGWMGNTVWSIVQTQQAQLTQLNIELAKNYMPRVELQQQLDRMTAQLDRIAQQTSKP